TPTSAAMCNTGRINIGESPTTENIRERDNYSDHIHSNAVGVRIGIRYPGQTDARQFKTHRNASGPSQKDRRTNFGMGSDRKALRKENNTPHTHYKQTKPRRNPPPQREDIRIQMKKIVFLAVALLGGCSGTVGPQGGMTLPQIPAGCLVEGSYPILQIHFKCDRTKATQ